MSAAEVMRAPEQDLVVVLLALHERLEGDAPREEDGWRETAEEALERVCRAAESLGPSARDIATMALRRLQQPTPVEPFQLVLELRGALAALLEELGATTSAPPSQDVDLARAARARVITLGWALGAQPHEAFVARRRLRSFGNALALAQSDEAFARALGSHAADLLDVQARLQRHLARDPAAIAPCETLRLWQDCAATTTLLLSFVAGDVRARDRQELEALRQRLAQRQRLSRETLRRFRALAGLSAEMDALFAAHETDAQRWQAALRQAGEEE